jgi:hypothetical protein
MARSRVTPLALSLDGDRTGRDTRTALRYMSGLRLRRAFWPQPPVARQ